MENRNCQNVLDYADSDNDDNDDDQNACIIT